MTDEDRAAIERARAMGIDISLLESNLRLTPTERLRRAEAFLRFIGEVREAGERARLEQRRNVNKPLPGTADQAAR